MPTTLRNTDILFNDGSTQATAATAGGLVTTTNVLNATAGATVGAVGTYSILFYNANPFNLVSGTAYAGSLLRIGIFAAFNTGYPMYGYGSVSPAGTWRFFGPSYGALGTPGGLFLRIS